MEENDKKPVAHHAYLTDASGGLLPLYELTTERCPSCPRHRNGVLGIVFTSKDKRSQTVQCTLCDYSLTRPYRDPPGRKMNSGA